MHTLAIAFAAGCVLGSAASLGFGVMGAWDAHHGYNLCVGRHDWFDPEGVKYTFEYANLNLHRMFISLIPSFVCFVGAVVCSNWR
jgi:hypothetical protein